MNYKRLRESKKAIMFLIVLVVTIALFVFGAVWNTDSVRLIEKVWDGLMVYLGAQGGQNVAAHFRPPQPVRIPSSTPIPDRYADK